MKLKFIVTMFIVLGLFIVPVNSEMVKSNECKINQSIKDYYAGLLVAMTSNMKNFKIDKDKTAIYSTKIKKDLCLYYMDPEELHLNIDSSRFFIFMNTDEGYMYPYIIDANKQIDLNSYYQAKLIKLDNSIDYTKGIEIYNNGKSDNNIVIFLSTECPYCAMLYKTLYSNFKELKGVDANVYLFLMSADENKVKLFTSYADKHNGLDLAEVLFNYFNDNALSSGASDLQAKYKELKKIDYTNFSDVKVKAMRNEFEKLGASGVPVTIINNKLISGANLPLINVLLKDEEIISKDLK